MSQVINGGNAAIPYLAVFAHAQEFLRAETQELQRGVPPALDRFFSATENQDLRAYATRRLIVDSYRKSGRLHPNKEYNEGKIVKEVRELTTRALEDLKFRTSDPVNTSFLVGFYETLESFGEEDVGTEEGCVPGRYSFGTRDFDDDD